MLRTRAISMIILFKLLSCDNARIPDCSIDPIAIHSVTSDISVLTAYPYAYTDDPIDAYGRLELLTNGNGLCANEFYNNYATDSLFRQERIKSWLRWFESEKCYINIEKINDSIKNYNLENVPDISLY